MPEVIRGSRSHNDPSPPSLHVSTPLSPNRDAASPTSPMSPSGLRHVAFESVIDGEYRFFDPVRHQLTYRRLGCAIYLGYCLGNHQRILGPKVHAQRKRGVGNRQKFRDF